jgi:CDP-diacylglycerol--glycerol-3-phosphate 3-phosphatidyltransferase
MLSERLRAHLTGTMQTIGIALGRTGLSPNFFTWVGFLAVVANAWLIAYGDLRWAGILLIFTLSLDSLDGAVARATNQVSKFGAFLDSTLDRWAEVAIFFGMAVALHRNGDTLDLVLIYWAICASLLVSYTRARAEGIGVQCREGWFTRFERMVVIIAGLITEWLTLANGTIAVMASITAMQRLWLVYQHTQGNGDQG